MANNCELTGKSYQKGHQVSHSNRKMIKRFAPNLQNMSFYSETLAKSIQLHVAASTARTIDKYGGLDAFLSGTSNLKLTKEAVRLKKRILDKTSKQAAQA